MSRDSSPPGSSDDSAVGSMSSNLTNSLGSSLNRESSCQLKLSKTTYSRRATNKNHHALSKTNNKEIINSDDLISAAKQMRRNNVGLISRSIRTHLSCFDEFDVSKFETSGDFFVNFVSNGVLKCEQGTILRPVSILWPDNYDKITEQLGILDAFLLNTEFYDKPVNWMLKRGLTSVPVCRLCGHKMTLEVDENIVRWQCKRSQSCSNYYIPIQRPSFFSGFEKVGLKKLLFAVYFWATCTPGEDLISVLNLESRILNGIWRRIQNVCRTALEKSYPRHRLTDCLDPENTTDKETKIPIDLISIKLNRVFIVCAKHPSSNFVRLGLHIPNLSSYSFAELTESWFAHGASVRVSEKKFLNLAKRRGDLKLQIVGKPEMIAKNGKFDRDSAFGYLVTQLTHVFKDYDSTGLPTESLKLMLAELQWREHYGKTPYDAFTNIVNHMAQYGASSDYYLEVSLPKENEENCQDTDLEAVSRSLDSTQYVWAEKYFYATIEPLDEEGNVISRKPEIRNPDNTQPNALVTCHICEMKFECFEFAMHLIRHVEESRKDQVWHQELGEKGLIECKHCFKTYPREFIVIHSTLLRTFLQPYKYACRICCIKLDDRDSFLKHMREKHFSSETPYKCPKCKFASSFQRDVFLHFYEEHRHNMYVMCSLCLTGFTIGDSINITASKVKLLSKVVYNHLAHHYVVSRKFACSNCCLCFLDEESLRNHVQLRHDPCEIRNMDNLKLEHFIIDFDEEKFCVKALPTELFIANKRPNLISDRSYHTTNTTDDYDSMINTLPSNQADILNRLDKNGINATSSIATSSIPEEESTDLRVENDLSTIEDCRETSNSLQPDDEVIHVRGASEFLAGGNPELSVQKNRVTTKLSTNDNLPECTSQRLYDYFSRLSKADGIIANQCVILTPTNKPAKCIECQEYITVDHFVSQIKCQSCKYTTLCPRAATAHFRANHG